MLYEPAHLVGRVAVAAFGLVGGVERVSAARPDTDRRTFYHDNVMWIVGERAARDTDTEHAHLVFESDECARRVRNFPENWRELGPDELYELSWRV